jgi:pilus assembly protein CpaE
MKSQDPPIPGAPSAVAGALIGLSIALCACKHTTDVVTTAGVPDDYRLRHPIAVQEADRSIVVFVGRGRGGLSASQRADVMYLGQTWMREGTGIISIDVPVNTPNARAAEDSLREIQATLAAAGVPPRATNVRQYRPEDPRHMAAIRLNYPKISAVAGPCGLWPEDLGPSVNNKSYFENKSYYNFGCSNQRNLAAMVDNPSDLVQPRPETPAYTPRRGMALREISQGHSTATTYPETTRPNSAIPANDHLLAPEYRTAAGSHGAVHRGSHRAGAAGVGAGFLRDGGNRGRRAVGGRRPPPRQGSPQDPDGRHGRRRRGLPLGPDPERHHPGDRRPPRHSLGLDQLATVCDAGTRVIVIGRINDVMLYRELVRRGVSDYVIAPVNAIDVVRSVCNLFSAPEAKAVGRIIAIVGAKGGVGSSTVAHNVAWAIARDLSLDSVVADLDLAFGTAGLDYNQDPPQGIADAVFSPDRIDTAFLDRLLSKCTDHLSLLAAPATLDRVYDFGVEAFDSIFDTLRTTMPCIVLDVPHQWSGWTKRALIAADDILIVAAPDLANLRNTKNIFDLLKASRPNDRAPLYCLNQVGIPKRPEIPAAEFAKAIENHPIATIPFEPQIFGSAANNGQMIAEISATHRTTEMFLQIAQRLTGRGETKKPKSSLLSPLIEKLRAKK